MSVQLHSYINFDGNAREAMEYYHSIFGGELTANTFGESASEQMPVEPEDMDKIMHAFLKGEGGIELMGSDAPMNMPRDNGSRITLSLSGDDEAVLRAYWDRLSEGGSISVPLDPSPWGDTFGMLTDKFGVGWMIDIRHIADV